MTGINIPQRMTKKELRGRYNVCHKTMNGWLARIKELGEPDFGHLGYSRRQIIMIYKHLGLP